MFLCCLSCLFEVAGHILSGLAIHLIIFADASDPIRSVFIFHYPVSSLDSSFFVPVCCSAPLLVLLVFVVTPAFVVYRIRFELCVSHWSCAVLPLPACPCHCTVPRVRPVPDHLRFVWHPIPPVCNPVKGPTAEDVCLLLLFVLLSIARTRIRPKCLTPPGSPFSVP